MGSMRCFVLFLFLVVSSLSVQAASGWPPDPWEGTGPRFGRQILQRNNTLPGDSSLSPARFTGALALYSLFGLFVISSISTCVIGVVVTLQWPNPRICCYRTPYSDIPNSESCGCCALHRLNIGFAVTWLALLVLLVLALIVYLMAAAAVLAVIHAVIAYRIIRQLKASSHVTSNNIQMATVVGAGGPTPTGLVTGVAVDCPLPGVPVPGIPVMSVPMSVAVVEAQLQTHINFANAIGNAIGNRNSGNEERSSSNGGPVGGGRGSCRAAWPLVMAGAAVAGEGGIAVGATAAGSAAVVEGRDGGLQPAGHAEAGASPSEAGQGAANRLLPASARPSGSLTLSQLPRPSSWLPPQEDAAAAATGFGVGGRDYGSGTGSGSWQEGAVLPNGVPVPQSEQRQELQPQQLSQQLLPPQHEASAAVQPGAWVPAWLGVTAGAPVSGTSGAGTPAGAPAGPGTAASAAHGAGQ